MTVDRFSPTADALAGCRECGGDPARCDIDLCSCEADGSAEAMAAFRLDTASDELRELAAGSRSAEFEQACAQVEGGFGSAVPGSLVIEEIGYGPYAPSREVVISRDARRAVRELDSSNLDDVIDGFVDPRDGEAGS